LDERVEGDEIRRSRWYHGAVTVGLVSYGIVHLVLAWIAVQVAFGRHKDASAQGAMKELAAQPLGALLLWVMAVGLLSLTVWQVIQAIVGRGDPHKRLNARRAVSVCRAAVYLVLAVLAGKVAIGSGSQSGQSEQTASARLMQLPAGRLAVAAIGVAILAVGVTQVVKGLRRRFVEQDLEAAGRVIEGLGAVGWVTKGIAISIVGVLFGLAAITHDPQKAGGLDQALIALRDQPFGTWLLVLVAAGFACFGVYCFAWSRHAKY
jgi:hypothetical protein